MKDIGKWDKEEEDEEEEEERNLIRNLYIWLERFLSMFELNGWKSWVVIIRWFKEI